MEDLLGHVTMSRSLDFGMLSKSCKQVTSHPGRCTVILESAVAFEPHASEVLSDSGCGPNCHDPVLFNFTAGAGPTPRVPLIVEVVSPFGNFLL